VHQIADFPHQRLVLVDDRLDGLAILIEAGLGHPRFDRANRRLAFLDPRFELIDPLLPRLQLARALPRLGIDALLSFVPFPPFLPFLLFPPYLPYLPYLPYPPHPPHLPLR